MQSHLNICGIGLRHLHYQEIIETLPVIPLLEIHSENFFSQSSRLHHNLKIISANYNLSFHSVSMSLGSTDNLSIDYLSRLKELVDEYKPQFISDHLAWASVDNIYLHDLLPLSYTLESLDLFKKKVDFVQNYLGTQILIENPSTYVSFAESSMSETKFLNELVASTGCGLLLDINNIFISSRNLSYNPIAYLDDINVNAVKQIHLAGFEDNSSGILIDTHSQAPSKEVLGLFKYFVGKYGTRPTIFEQDQNLGSLSSLLTIADQINNIATIEQLGS